MTGTNFSQPLTAAGTNWVSVSNALSLGSGYASYPALNSPSQWLILTNFSNRRIFPASPAISGFQVNLFVNGTGGLSPVKIGAVARIYQGVASAMTGTTGLTTDGSDTTYYGDTNTLTATTALTVIHDFGEAVTVTTANILGRVENTGGASNFQYSDDGIAWTTVPRSGTAPITFHGDFTDNFTVNGTVSARYWRMTLQEVYSGSPVRVRCYTFDLFNGATRLTNGSYVQTTAERIEVGLTKDGSTITGTTKVIYLNPTDSAYTLGDANDLWGGTWIPSDIDNPNFGVMIRRPQGANDNQYTERRVDFVNLAFSYSYVPVASMRPAALQTALLGKQVDRETVATPSIRTKSFALQPQPQNENKTYDAIGDMVPQDYAIAFEQSSVSASFDPSYDEMGLLLASVFGKPTSQLISTGVYRHTFVLNTRGAANPQWYTTQFGDVNHAEQTQSVILAAFGLEWSGKKTITGSASGFGRKVDGTIAAIQAGANCVQTLTAPTGTPTSFRLRFLGAETADIVVAGMSASTIQTALLALTTIGGSNVAVAGTGPWTITFQGTLAGVPQPLIEVSKITGGTSPTVPISITTPGGYTEFPFTPMLAGQLRAYYSDTVANLSNSSKVMTTLLKGSVNIDSRFVPVEVTNDANASWGPHAETNMNLGAKFTVSADAVSAGFETDARARNSMFFRLQATGPIIPTTSTNYQLYFDMAMKVKNIMNIQMDGAVVAREFEIGARFDAGWNQAAQIVLVNGVASY